MQTGLTPSHGFEFRSTADPVPAGEITFSPDGKTLAATANRRVKQWDLATDKERPELSGHTAMVMSVVFSPDGKTLASSAWDGTVKLWDAATSELQCTLPNNLGEVNCSLFSPNGNMIALAGRDGTIRLLRAASEEEVRDAGWYVD